ncbi:VPS35 endosomal protein-sorting factor-like isoform X1 [Phoenix dactylifera]|uniref:VPS35 endosomal protein-sorting factor-like isoform X1 n=1 Tax=Phoenix dactylifera TaxID=42345 RepID=A0A8B7BL43_PHODC|nr:VPS35 endosomal protein-sorting factor-like isoform X1 [Phoenix dactylifera]
MEFRLRDYEGEEIAAALPRVPALDHPLAPCPFSSSQSQGVAGCEKVDFDDPLRVRTTDVAECVEDGKHVDGDLRRILSSEDGHLSTKEWALFKSSLMQKFSCSNMISVSFTSDILARNSKEYKTLADMHMEELDDPEMVVREEKKVITRQEYVSRLQELKGEISQAWRADDRIKALKLSIKVARLLLDTSGFQFYPTLFVLVIDIMDMLGDLVWERIKRKAEYADDGTLIYSLPEKFQSADICSEAKETCYNWFCKIGSIRELLPRIYLELAILRCWRFLGDNFLLNLQRLAMMMRGVADPLASAFCHLYMAHCARTLHPIDIGYLIMSLSNIGILLQRIIVDKETFNSHYYKNKKMLISLMEPAIEWIMKCIFMDGYQKSGNLISKFGIGGNLLQSTWNIPCISVILHCLLKQLPAEVVSNNALEIAELFEKTIDISLDQHFNYRLLGNKLCESHPPVPSAGPVLDKVIQVISQYNNLNEYLIVADAYLDIILQYSMDYYLSVIFDGILKRAKIKRADENELESLQSVLVKLVDHFDALEDAFALNHFLEILDLLYGSARDITSMHILLKATRTGHVCDPRAIQFLFEISQALHDSIDISNTNDDYQQRAFLITRFVHLVDFGAEIERHLTFLIECRAAFHHIDELKDTLVHLSNNLAVKAIKDTDKYLSFLKSCLAFNEVTIPSISNSIRCMTLYLETAEVALFGGLDSHAEGLVNSAINCLQCLNITAGFHKSVDVDQILSLTCKMCSLLVMIPGIHEEGIAFFARSLISVLNYQSSTSSRIKVKIFCAVIFLSASLSQYRLPYHAINAEVVGNDQLFYGEPSYHQELSSISTLALQNLDDAIGEESHLVTRGSLALEACNCLLTCFNGSCELFLKCSGLIEIAKSCLHPKDKYLQSTVNFFDKCSKKKEVAFS